MDSFQIVEGSHFCPLPSGRSDNYSSTPEKKRKASNLAPSSPEKKSRSINDAGGLIDEQLDDFFEESSPSQILPVYDQVELRDFHQRSSAFGKLSSYQQTLQLGMSAVKVCFEKVIPGQYLKDESFMEQLFTVIFFKCSERRMMLEGKTPTSMFTSPICLSTENLYFLNRNPRPINGL